jgi:hypothetical protein
MATPNLAIRLQFEPVRSLGEASIGAGYMGVGTPIANPARQFFIQNLTDVTLMFSFDGINDHFPLPSNGFLLDDVTSNKTQQGGFYIAEGTRLYVKEIGTPSTGSVYFSVMFGSDV